MLLRQYYRVDRSHLAEFALIWVVMLFVIVLLHEFGHCFAARRGGRGGGRDPDVAARRAGLLRRPAHAAGQLHHGRRRAVGQRGHLPGRRRRPVRRRLPARRSTSSRPASSTTRSCTTGRPARTASRTPDVAVLHRRRQRQDVTLPLRGRRDRTRTYRRPVDRGRASSVEVEPAGRSSVYPTWVLWTARLFWLSWVLFLFNLIPAFPLDGGRHPPVHPLGPVRATTGRPRRWPAGAG